MCSQNHSDPYLSTGWSNANLRHVPFGLYHFPQTCKQNAAGGIYTPDSWIHLANLKWRYLVKMDVHNTDIKHSIFAKLEIFKLNQLWTYIIMHW